MPRMRTPVLVAVIGAVGVVTSAAIPACRDILVDFLSPPKALVYRGAVRDSVSNLPVKGALVVAIGRSDVTPVRTDDFGNFQLTIPREKRREAVSIRLQVTEASHVEFNRVIDLSKSQVETSLVIEPKLAPTPVPTVAVSRAQEWPSTWDALQTAELQLSDIDDFMSVSVNGRPVIRAQYGETPPWISIRQFLHRGPNRIEVIIENGQYGGCGGTLALRLNHVLDSNYRWTWSTSENKPPNIVCFQQVKTLNLE